MDLLTVVSGVLLGFGSFLLFSGGLGLLRFPDFYTRIHATSISETLGAALMIIGLMCLTSFGIVLFKLIFILLFLLFTAPTAGHTMARAAEHGGLKPYARESRKSGRPHDGGQI
jgi:multicomponent Na+:H+ antiporter subunit G